MLLLKDSRQSWRGTGGTHTSPLAPVSCGNNKSISSLRVLSSLFVEN